MKKILTLSLLITFISILYFRHTVTIETYLCTNCGQSKKVNYIYFYHQRIQYKPSTPIHTIENRLYRDIGGPPCAHKWKVHFTSSSGWLGDFDGPIGDYGLDFHGNQDTYRYVLAKLRKLPTIDEQIKMIWTLRYDFDELAKWLNEASRPTPAN